MVALQSLPAFAQFVVNRSVKSNKAATRPPGAGAASANAFTLIWPMLAKFSSRHGISIFRFSAHVFG